MVKTDDMNTPEKHEPDEFSPPDEYFAGDQDGEPKGYSLQFDDDDRDSWNYDNEYRRKKDHHDEEDDYLKDEEDMDIEEEEEEIFGENRPAWSISEEEEEEEEPAPAISSVAPIATPFAPEPAPPAIQ